MIQRAPVWAPPIRRWEIEGSRLRAEGRRAVTASPECPQRDAIGGISDAPGRSTQDPVGVRRLRGSSRWDRHEECDRGEPERIRPFEGSRGPANPPSSGSQWHWAARFRRVNPATTPSTVIRIHSFYSRENPWRFKTLRRSVLMGCDTRRAECSIQPYSSTSPGLPGTGTCRPW